MSENYYVLSCEDPDEGYLARLSYSPDDSARSWILGERFAVLPPTPVQASARGLDDEDTVMAELWKSPLPAMSKRLHAALLAAGVANLDVYPLDIHDPASGRTLQDHVAFNLIGKAAVVDMQQAVLAAGTKERTASASFDSLAIDESRVGGLLMFRLAEALSTIVVHRTVRERVEAAGIRTLSFYVPSDWTT